jgi:hypothetical protein
MKSSDIYVVLFLISSFSLLFHIRCSAQVTDKQDIISGEEFLFHSEYLDRPIRIYISLPENYKNSICRYPVHYVLDAQIAFRFYNGVADILSKGEIPACIIVGIQTYNRGKYFTPGEGMSTYTRFLKEELIPFIDQTYRTKPFRLIFGHSSTGTYVINSLLHHSGLFDMYIAGAPYQCGLFFNENLDPLFDRIDKDKFLYVFYGLDDNAQQRAAWDSLSEMIVARHNSMIHLFKKTYENEDHYSVLFRYVPDGLKLAFKNWRYAPPPDQPFVVSEFMKSYDSQKSRFGVSFSYSEGYFADVAIKLSKEGTSKDFFIFINDGLTYYPNSTTLHNIIAVEYEKSGDIEKAKMHYSKMLEIDPGLDFVRNKLAELEK